MRRVFLGLLLAAVCGCSHDMVQNAEREALLYGPPRTVSQDLGH